MTTIYEKAFKSGEKTRQQAFEIGLKTRYIIDRSINNISRPEFKISKRQHCRIMEILDIKHNKSKKMFHTYLITVLE